MTNFRHSRLYGTIYKDQDLSNTDFSFSNLIKAQFINCNLTNTNLENCTLFGTKFINCNLDKTNFHEAKINNDTVFDSKLLKSTNMQMLGEHPIINSTKVGTYIVNFTDTLLQIGCMNYTLDEWFDMIPARTAKMHVGARRFRNKHEATITDLINNKLGTKYTPRKN